MSEPSAELGTGTTPFQRDRPVQFRANETARDVFAIAPLLPV